MLSAWPGIRLVNKSGVPDLETFVQVVDTLPSFNGDVIVSNTTVLFTFVPEPSSLVLLVAGCLGIAAARRQSHHPSGITSAMLQSSVASFRYVLQKPFGPD